MKRPSRRTPSFDALEGKALMSTAGGAAANAAASRYARYIANLTAYVEAMANPTLRGTYNAPATRTADTGAVAHLQGSGNIGGAGRLQFRGELRSPGFIANGKVEGDLTFRNNRGTVTLHLTGPEGPLVVGKLTTYTFVSTEATGAYRGNSGSGTVDIMLTPIGKIAPNSGGHGRLTMLMHFATAPATTT